METQIDAALLKAAKAFRTKKHLGQHFLVDRNVLESIVEALELDSSSEVIEIGPGIGFLTRLLTHTGANVESIDLDRQSVEYLRQLKIPKLRVRHGDILAYDLGQRRFKTEPENSANARPPGTPVKIAGNIPYQITGLIISHLLGEVARPSPWIGNIERIVMMVQKEVALRMVAGAGERDYSRLSILMKYFGQAEILLQVPKRAFYPIPEVDSAVVLIKPQTPTLECRNHDFLAKVIKAGFKSRRKMLRNALSAIHLDDELLDSVFKELDIDPQVRAESLSLEQFAFISDALDHRSKCKI